MKRRAAHSTKDKCGSCANLNVFTAGRVVHKHTNRVVHNNALLQNAECTAAKPLSGF
jgi:hypothetical protein